MHPDGTISEDTRYGSEKTGLLCGYLFEPGRPGQAISADEAVAACPPGHGHTPFAWLHFNLANQASRRWLTAHLSLEDAFLAALDQAGSTRLELAGDTIIAVLNDVTMSGADPSDVSTVALSVNEGMFISLRRTPLRSVDRLRAAVLRGECFRSPVDLLAHLLRDQATMLANIVHDAGAEVDDLEDRLIARQVAASRHKLGALRRTLVRLQRLLAPEPSALFRMLNKPPAWLGADDVAGLREAAEEVAVAVGDGAALIERIKSLQEEVFAVVSEQTNQTLFTLTVVTVLALPMTIISGFLGMNVGHVPLQDHAGAFWMVVVFTAAISAVAALLLFRR